MEQGSQINDEFQFEIVDRTRLDQLSDIISDHFYDDHPIFSIFGLNRYNGEGFLDRYIKLGFGEPPMSIICLKNGQILGCCMCVLIDDQKANFHDYEVLSSRDHKYLSKNVQILSDYYAKLGGDMGNFVPNQKYTRLLFAWVNEQYRRKGLAEKMTKMVLERAKSLACKSVICTANSFKGQAMFKKLGFQVMKTLLHKDFTDVDGRPMFQCKDQSYCGQILKLNL
uniref:N-acetyltransferase domain-containing protein n=1 Tax=Romanomermis culicivorax TaxID=13658 RepID=A0A915J647_ROMCU